MYLQDHLILISSEEPKEEEVGISQVSPVVKDVVAEEEVYFYMDKVKEEYLDMSEVEVEEAVQEAMVDVAVVVKAVEKEVITIVTTTI